MSWHLVDGVPLPDPVGGHPALDFCNTRAGWAAAEAGGPAKEYLTSPRALVLWAVDAGLLLPGPVSGREGEDHRAGEDVDALARALVLRDALYRAALQRGTPSDWQSISREIAAARLVGTLHPVPGGPARWTLDRPEDATPLAALHAVADAAEELLTSALAGCVAACPGTGCGWLFADRRRRRRWCSMAVCGNRAKARRHAARVTPVRMDHSL